MEISEIHDLLHTDRKVYKTHLADLNDLLCGGIPEDSLMVVTSGVSVGKSMLAQNLFTSVYLQNTDKKALAFTLESSKYDFLRRVFSSLTAIKQNEIFDKIKSNSDLEKSLEILFSNLLLSTKSNACYIRDLLENGNNEYSCILIDGLYLIDDLYSNSQKLNDFLRFLRQYALNTKTPIIITVPLKRSNYKNEDLDLNSCVGKTIICNSNIILCMTREKNADNGKIKILKNSYGGLGEFSFNFFPEYAYVSDCLEEGKITLFKDLNKYAHFTD
jgi:archaellum biogenesis ATPase FlaH